MNTVDRLKQAMKREEAMSIDERIEAVMKSELEKWDAEHPPEIYDAPYERPRDRDTFVRGISAGYRAALKGLFHTNFPVVLCEDGQSYWIVVDGKHEEATFYRGDKQSGFFEYDTEVDGEARSVTIDADKVDSFGRFNLPSPSEVFGEEVG